MELDDELCLCFHVTKRKVVNYIRLHQPKRVGQLSDCFGAGTGCGWCRTYLGRLFDQSQSQLNEPPVMTALDPATESPTSAEPSASEYAQLRSAYVKSGKGTPPPGATPVSS